MLQSQFEVRGGKSSFARPQSWNTFKPVWLLVDRWWNVVSLRANVVSYRFASGVFVGSWERPCEGYRPDSLGLFVCINYLAYTRIWKKLMIPSAAIEWHQCVMHSHTNTHTFRVWVCARERFNTRFEICVTRMLSQRHYEDGISQHANLWLQVVWLWSAGSGCDTINRMAGVSVSLSRERFISIRLVSPVVFGRIISMNEAD